MKKNKNELKCSIAKLVWLKSLARKTIRLRDAEVVIGFEDEIEAISGQLREGGAETALSMLEEMLESGAFDACLPIVLKIISDKFTSSVDNVGKEIVIRHEDFEILRIENDKILINPMEKVDEKSRLKIIEKLLHYVK